VVLRAISLGVLAIIWWKARRDASDPAGFPAAASVATVIAFSPVSSSQYVAWLLPWAAVAIEERPRSSLLLAAMTASVMSATAFVVYWRVDSAALLAWVALLRAAAIVVIPLLWLLESNNEPSPTPEVP
jgi:hypothetical protein